jgi:hypothetical protein
MDDIGFEPVASCLLSMLILFGVSTVDLGRVKSLPDDRLSSFTVKH